MTPFSNALMMGVAASALLPATWDPSNKDANITLSSGNTVATNVAGVTGYIGAKGFPQTAGKLYLEMVPTFLIASVVGMARSAASNSSPMQTSVDAVVYINSGDVNVAGSGVAVIPTFLSGNTVQIAVDFTASKIWFGVNNTFDGNPAAGTGGYTLNSGGANMGYPTFSLRNPTDTMTIKGAGTITYTPPSGFSAWTP